mmetsp:Transcript_60344/g.127828  ORF Transcript_60344/g.127828 Transcript_60344/m.127828 type:complete len:85 (-) Transcript_60344:1384-1638(-)
MPGRKAKVGALLVNIGKVKEENVANLEALSLGKATHRKLFHPTPQLLQDAYHPRHRQRRRQQQRRQHLLFDVHLVHLPSQRRGA